MTRISIKRSAGIWTANLITLAFTVFFISFGEGVVGASSTNFYVDTLGLTGGQVLGLEGIRELPGLILMFIAALSMHLPLSRRAAASVLIYGLGYMSYAAVHSYTALLATAILASLGMHMWMPLNSSLGLGLATKDTAGRVLGSLASVAALAGIVGLGATALISKVLIDFPLRGSYLFGGGLTILAGLLLFRIPKNVGSTREVQPRMLIKRRYWLYYVLTFFEGSRKQVLNTFGSLVLVQIYHFEVWQISSLLLVSSIVNFFSSPFLGYLVDRFGERTTLSASYVALALCCLGYTFISQVWILAALLTLIKLLIVLGMGLSTYVNRIAPPEELTPTLSAGISINHVTSVAMPLVAGVLLPIIGYQGIFLGAAGLILLSVPFALAMRVPKPAPAAAEMVPAK